MKNKEAIAKRIKEGRKALNLNQEEISAKMGIARNTFSQYESGKATMSMDVFAKFIAITGFSADWILFGKKVGPSTKPNRYELDKQLDSLNDKALDEISILIQAYLINNPKAKKK